MEPNHETTPEQHAPGGPERLPDSISPEQQEGLPPTPEKEPQRQETREQLSGAGAGDNPPPQALPTPTMPQPTAPDDGGGDNVVSVPKVDENPLVADDVDVIEKEWVDRTKKILNETKDDPHQKEHDISHLQADYLQKRFGVEVKLPQG